LSFSKANFRREELVDLANIEMIHKKRRHDKDARFRSFCFPTVKAALH
jgi:hypothetical protein